MKGEMCLKDGELNKDQEFVPGPPDGSPPANLCQPTLKNPSKFIVSQLIYFHYNINDHSMYVSPYPYPTHMNNSQKTLPTSTTPLTSSTFPYKSKESPSDLKMNGPPRKSSNKYTHHSSESNLIVVQPNVDSNTVYGSSPMQYMSGSHHQPSPVQQPIPTHYTSNQTAQIGYRMPQQSMHQAYASPVMPPTQGYTHSSANNIYPTSN